MGDVEDELFWLRVGIKLGRFFFFTQNPSHYLNQSLDSTNCCECSKNSRSCHIDFSMAPSKTLPGQRDLNRTHRLAHTQTSTVLTPSNTTATLPAATAKKSIQSGCAHTREALSSRLNHFLRSYELAVRVSLEQAVAAASASGHRQQGPEKRSQNGGVSKRAGTGSKTLPGARKTILQKKDIIKRHKTPKFLTLCEACKTSNSTAIICLECSFIGCVQHFAKTHAPSTGHILGVDLSTGSEGLLFCSSCNDYVYDDSFEQVRMRKLQQFLGLGVVEELPAGALREKQKDSTGYAQVASSKASVPTFQATSALRGFYNMGATCFMSVIFQSLIHNPLVRNFYLSGGHERGVKCGSGASNNSNGLGSRGDGDHTEKSTPASDSTPIISSTPSATCLACALDDVFAEFFTSSSVAGYGPTNLLTTSWRVKRSLAGYSEQDAHEFLQMVLNELHTSHYDSQVLASGASQALGQVGLPVGSLPSDLREREEINIQNCGCISHRTFCGELESKITCQTCGTVSSTVCDPMMDISLEIGALPEHGFTRSSVAGKSVPRVAPPKSVTLEQCLDRFTAGETLDATFKCNECNMKRPIQKRLSIRRLPSVLSIQLKVNITSDRGIITIH